MRKNHTLDMESCAARHTVLTVACESRDTKKDGKQQWALSPLRDTCIH